MKKTRKIVAVMLALVLCFAMALPAMAATITIEKSKTLDASTRQFLAYKVLGASKAGTTKDGKQQIAYTVPNGLITFYNQTFSIPTTDPSFSYKVAQAIGLEKGNNDQALYEFGAKVLQAAKDANITGKSGQATSDGNYVFTDLEPGYYVIEDVTEGLDNKTSFASALMLKTTTEEAKVVIKADTPSIEKWIDGKNDEDPDTKGDTDNNNASIGDKVPYIIKTTVPSMNGYTKYKYVITDTLSAGLEYNKGSLEVALDDAPLTYQTDYDLSVNKNEDGTTTIKIVFIDFLLRHQADAGKEIRVTYDATVDDDAVLGSTGNPNDVILEFSNNPTEVKDGDDFISDESKGETPKIEVKTFVVGLVLEKINSKNEPLAGAQFTIKGTRLNRTHVEGSAFVKIEEGEEYTGDVYYQLTDETYTKEAPTDATKDNYMSTSDTYKLVDQSHMDESKEDVSGTLIVGSDGKLVMEGLGAGEYEIKEIVAPDGYNLLDGSIIVNINYAYNNDTAKTCTWSGTYTFGGETKDLAFDAANGHITGLQIVNYTGTELPGTGGIGTTIFYVIGICLVAGAVILLVARKRMNSNS